MFGTEPPTDQQLDPGFELRTVQRIFKRDPVLWEVFFENEAIGLIRPTRIGRARYPFYEAIGYFPVKNERVSLELSTDLAERCRTVLEFRRAPQKSVHLPRHLKSSK